MAELKMGVTLPSFGVKEIGELAHHARHAEQVGLESVWVGDHLIPVRPFLDSTLVLATAAAVTETIKLGFGVMVLALRPVAWAAKQIATLQHLSGDRVLVGVGVGGSVHGDAAWRAVGVPYRERGKRTDAALDLLPSLVRGEPTTIDGEQITLSPAATMPPVLVAGGPATLRRAAKYGDEWYPAFSAPEAIAAATRQLADLAAEYGRPTPAVTIGLSVGLGDIPPEELASQVRSLTEYGLSEAEAKAALVTGSPAKAAEHFAALAEAGVSRIVGMPFTQDRYAQAELLAEATRLVNR